ncbi:MAG: hypothetical protein Q8P23_01640 [bacterium]|nr:hypothetical protein [bacterium]
MAKAKKTSKGKMAAEIGAGLLAAGAAAAAGYYFYGSKRAKKHRKIAAKWASGMKNEVIREAKSLKKINPKDFAKVVDTVAGTYRGVRSINAADLKRAANELKANWKMVEREIGTTGRKSAAHAKVVGKRVLARSRRTVKKIAKKVAEKKRTRR